MTRISKNARRIIFIAAMATFSLALAPTALAANSTAPSAILQQYRDQRLTWFANVWPYANNLFGMLALIEFAWSAAVMLLEKPDLQSWTAALVRKIMWLGAFYALLLYGRTWIPAIIDSFEMIGQNAASTGPMSPSDVFDRGINLAAGLMATSSAAAFFTNLGTSLTMVITGIITALAFIAITVQFVVAMVESYLIVAAGFIFVGFGGSRWTAPYVERYIGLAVSNGVKIMLLYLLIGTGMQLSVDWMTQAQNIATNASPAMSALEIMGASIIFMMLCWQIPKLFAAVLGGSPALSGGDLLSSASVLAGGAVALGSAALTGGASLAAGGAAAGRGMMAISEAAVATGGPSSTAGLGSSFSAAGHGAAVFSSGSGGGPTPPPPESTASNGPKPPSPPPSSTGANVASSPASESAQTPPPPADTGSPDNQPSTNTPAQKGSPNARTFKAQSPRNTLQNLSRQIPSDSAPHAVPPRMNIDHEE
jgi:type IV secretion system protein TrbL